MSEYLSVKNFDHYQHYKDRNPPWIKLYYAILDDPHFLALDEVQQGRYMKLLLVASKQDNRILNDQVYLSKVLRVSGKIDLTPLIHAGFLLASRKRHARHALAECKQNAMPETETEKNPETEKKRARARPLSDDEFLAALRTNPAYAHIDLDHELGKMDLWITVHPGRTKNRKFIVNWLNKIEKPLGAAQTSLCTWTVKSGYKLVPCKNPICEEAKRTGLPYCTDCLQIVKKHRERLGQPIQEVSHA